MEFQFNKTSEENLNCQYEITIDKSIIQEKINSKIEELKPKINLKGFRKGNLPHDIIIGKYGQSILHEESQKIINDAVSKLIKDESIKIAFRPKININQCKIDDDLIFVVNLELFPNIPEVNYDKIKITYRNPDVTESDINENIDKLLNSYAEYEKQEKSYKAKKYDAVNIDYKGYIDNEQFEGGSDNGFQLILGSKSFIDNFEDQLIGKKQDDEVIVKVKFPKNYQKIEFQGKSAKFIVKINHVLIPKKIELSDKFINEKFGLKNIDELKENITKHLTESYKNTSINLFKKELYDLFIKKYSFLLPESVVEEQFKMLFEDTKKQIESNPNLFKNEKELNKEKSKKREIAIRIVTAGYIISHISTKLKIEIKQEDITQEFQKIMAQYPGQQQQLIEFYQKNPDAINNIKEVITERKVVEDIIENSAVTKKNTALKDIDKLWQKANEE
jgi:trigger factor